MPSPDNRPRGILTPRDRDLLRGEIEYEHKQQYSNGRQDIRERIANGILDFSLIQYLLRDRDRKRIFQNPTDEASAEEPLFHESIRAMLYWTYFGLKEQNYDFERLLSEAVEQAEQDFARKYQGESVETSVRFDIEVTRSQDVDDLISLVEQGGPVKANRLYDLLELPGGVPIDTSKLDTVRVRFNSSYPEGEKAVLEALFSNYLGADVDIEDAVSRISPAEIGIEKENAVVESGRSRPDPSNIKYSQSQIDFETEENEFVPARRGNRGFASASDEDRSRSNESVLTEVINTQIEESNSLPPSIQQVIDDQTDVDNPIKEVSPESIVTLFESVREPFLSTAEVAEACECAPDVARQLLSDLFNDGQISRRSVVDNSGNRLVIWWLREE